MRNIRILLVLVSSVILLAGCVGDSSPSNEEIKRLVAEESMFADTGSLSLNDVTVQSISNEENNVKARLMISYNSSRSGMWGNEGARDPIPNRTKIERGINSLDVTAVFEKYDDGEWHLERFIR